MTIISRKARSVKPKLFIQMNVTQKHLNSIYLVFGGVLKSMLTLNEAIIDVKEG